LGQGQGEVGVGVGDLALGVFLFVQYSAPTPSEVTGGLTLDWVGFLLLNFKHTVQALGFLVFRFLFE
jgi:hypothetical protein